MYSRLLSALVVALSASTATTMLVIPGFPGIPAREIEKRAKAAILPASLDLLGSLGGAATTDTATNTPTTSASSASSSAPATTTSSAAATTSSAAPTTSSTPETTSSIAPSTTAPSTTSTQQAVTVTQVITTTNSDGAPTSYTTQSTVSPTASLSGPQSSTSGMSTTTRNTVIGVVVGVGGFIVLAAIALVIWRVWGRKRGQDESDGLVGYGPGDGYNAEKTEGGGATAGRTPFQSTLESYHAPTQVNQASNF